MRVKHLKYSTTTSNNSSSRYPRFSN
jgi:hypothetical protein